LTAVVLLGGCFEDVGGADACPVGAEGCACTAARSCDAGLACLSDLCVAEGVDAGGSTSATGTTGPTTGDAGGTETGGDANLVANGSFDGWNGALPQAWSQDAAAIVTQVSGDVPSPEYAARLLTIDYGTISQVLNGPFSAGTCFEATATVRWDAGSSDPPRILLLDDEYAPSAGAPFTWVDDMAWHPATVGLFLDHDTTWLEVSVGSDTADAQTFSIDDISLIEVEC
jgi:hypothetical protein